MRVAVERHLAILGSIIAAHHGVLYKRIGDGTQAAFATAVAGLSAALDAQRALLGEVWPEAPGALRVRMALHVGEAAPQDGDYLAPALNRLSRLLEAAHGGQVLLSEALVGLVQETLPDGVRLKALGEHRLRDLLEPEAIFQLLHPALPDQFPPLRTPGPLPHNLPIASHPVPGPRTGAGRAERAAAAAGGAAGDADRSGRGGQDAAGDCGWRPKSLESFPDGVVLVDLARLDGSGPGPLGHRHRAGGARASRTDR